MSIPRNSPCPCGSGKKYKHCCFRKDFVEAPATRKKVQFTLPGQENLSWQISDLDSIPAHNENGTNPIFTEDRLIDLCLDEIYTILKTEKVGMLADLVNSVVHDTNIVPNFTYREIGEQIKKDKRFAIHMLQVCSLSGTDPLELIANKLS